jgi:cytochrome c oxidase assembly protein Cox11
MPILFFVDPEILEDTSAMDVRDITLSYTFFRTPADKEIQNKSDKMVNSHTIKKVSKI